MKTPMNVLTSMKKKKKNRKGFSLVELIVVLVIMAILAAALVPTLIGYINQTRQSNAKNEAAAVVSAAQTIASSAYADPDLTYHDNTDGKDVKFTSAGAVATDSTSNFAAVLVTLSEVDGTIGTITFDSTFKVNSCTYTSKQGEVVIYNGSTYSIS